MHCVPDQKYFFQCLLSKNSTYLLTAVERITTDEATNDTKEFQNNFSRFEDIFSLI